MALPFVHSAVQPLPGLDMGALEKAPGAGLMKDPKTMAIGLKGPWHIDPGSPNFPNHRPYLANIKAPNTMPAAAPAHMKFPGGV